MSKVIGELQKNTTERIKVQLQEYKNVHFIDVRAFYENDSGEWMPTKKGIAIPLEKLGAIIAILQSAQEQLQKAEGK